MNEKKTIEQQVAELTEEQKDTILKVAKRGTIAQICAFPLVILLFIGVFMVFSDSPVVTDLFMLGLYILCAVCVFVYGGTALYIKAKCPYYSDRKAMYIKKSRKSK